MQNSEFTAQWPGKYIYYLPNFAIGEFDAAERPCKGYKASNVDFRNDCLLLDFLWIITYLSLLDKTLYLFGKNPLCSSPNKFLPSSSPQFVGLIFWGGGMWLPSDAPGTWRPFLMILGQPGDSM